MDTRRADQTGPTEPAPLLAVRGLSKRFAIPGSATCLQACDDISFELGHGETLGVVGESGSGKTTLGRCILRLLEPSGGEVIFDGHNLLEVSDPELRELRRHIQIVYQEPFESFNPFFSVGYQIAEPLRIHLRLPRAERRQRVLQLLNLVGLPAHMADASPTSLSGGALQRCSVARALATEPKLIVLDEPTSALSPEAEADILELLAHLRKRLNLSYVLISHDLSVVRQFCEMVAVMYLGQIVELGRQEDVFDHPQHPYSRGLLASELIPDPRRRRDADERRADLAGEIPSPIDLPRGCYLASRCPLVRERCHSERQPLSALSDGHLVRCWRVLEGDLGEQGRLRDRNDR